VPVVFLAVAGTLWAQTAPATPSPTTPATAPVLIPAVPYTEKEFPSWTLKLRRAEILTVGAFPLAYLLVGLGYDYTYYLSNGFPQANAPWPVGPGTSQWTMTTQPDLLQKKYITLVGMAVGASLLVAVADWLLGL